MASIDHLGIAVKSLATAKSIYEKLGLSASAEEVVEGEQVRVAMIPIGESRLELLEPTADTSVIDTSCCVFGSNWYTKVPPPG